MRFSAAQHVSVQEPSLYRKTDLYRKPHMYKRSGQYRRSSMYGRSARQAIPSLHHREHLELYYTCCQNTCTDCEKDFMGAEYYNSEKKSSSSTFSRQSQWLCRKGDGRASDSDQPGSFMLMLSKLAPHPSENTPICAPLMEWVILELSAFRSSI